MAWPCGRHFPGEIQKVLEWFRDYKIPDGKPANKFGYDNKCMNKEFTMHVIEVRPSRRAPQLRVAGGGLMRTVARRCICCEGEGPHFLAVCTGPADLY